MSKDFEQYFEQNATDGELSDDAMAKLLVGDMGDTAMADAADVPAAAPTVEVEPETQPAQPPEGDGKQGEGAGEGEAEPIILAKDGKSVIPYDKLVEARSEAKAAREANQALMQEMESIKQQVAAMNAGNVQPPPQRKPEQPPPDITQLEREWHEAMLDDDTDKMVEIRGKINGEIARQTRAEITGEIRAEQAAREQQAQAITAQQLLDQAAAETVKQYPELDASNGEGDSAKIAEIVEYRDFLIASKGIPAHEALQVAAKRVMGDSKVQTGPAAGDTAAPKASPPVKARTPTTMSDIPGGTAPHHDEAEAMMQLSSPALLGKMMGMTPDKIMETLARVV